MELLKTIMIKPAATASIESAQTVVSVQWRYAGSAARTPVNV